MEKHPFGLSFARRESGLLVPPHEAAQAAMAAYAIELADRHHMEEPETPFDEPRPLYSIDQDQPPKLYPDGTVEVTLSSGRCINLMTRTFGPEEGWPIIFCSGLPSSGMPDVPYQYMRDAHISNIRLVMWDRPGYGDSERWKGHRVGDGAVLMQAIAQAYNLGQFSVAGRSGGAPYALAAGALCPDAVNVAVFGCRAPSSANIDRLTGASSENEKLLGLADEEALAASFLSTSGEAIIRNPSAVIESILPNLSASDRRVVLEQSMRRYLRASHKNALKHDATGRIDNVLALRAHWCFELSDLGEKLVYIIQGAEQDEYTTLAHFDYLADHIPGGVPIARLDMGHMGTMALEMRIFRALTKNAQSRIY